jgi:hypothetical protein
MDLRNFADGISVIAVELREGAVRVRNRAMRALKRSMRVCK